MQAQSSQQNKCPGFARFLTDLGGRYPGPSGPDSPPAGADPGEAHEGTEFERRLGKLPTEIGALLMVIGVAGLMLPGPVGSPFVLAGGLVLWPKGFGKVEGWFERRFPGMHREGVTQIERFLTDLERRFPGSVG